MKKIIIAILMFLIIALSGCQYLLPSMVRAGSVDIKKNTKQVTPAKVETGPTITIEITPPGYKEKEDKNE